MRMFPTDGPEPLLLWTLLIVVVEEREFKNQQCKKNVKRELVRITIGCEMEKEGK